MRSRLRPSLRHNKARAFLRRPWQLPGFLSGDTSDIEVDTVGSWSVTLEAGEVGEVVVHMPAGEAVTSVEPFDGTAQSLALTGTKTWEHEADGLELIVKWRPGSSSAWQQISSITRNVVPATWEPDPSDADLALWLDSKKEAERRSLTTADTANLELWEDAGQNNNDATQATLDNQPLLAHDGTRWVVRADANDVMSLASLVNLDGNGATIFLVTQASLDGGQIGYSGDNGSFVNVEDAVLLLRAQGTYSQWDISTSATSQNIVVIRRSSAGEDHLRKNLADVGSPIANGVNVRLDTVLEGLGVHDNDLCAIMLYTRELTAEEISDHEGYLNTHCTVGL